MAHMQPRVFKDDVYVVTTKADGDLTIPKSDVGSHGASPDHKHFKDFVEDVEDITDVALEHGKWIAYTTAPGYMDKTDYAVFDNEGEAWTYLIDFHADVFEWAVDMTASEGEGPTAHMHCETEACAKAMLAQVQSVAGSKLERDGTFVYVPADDAEKTKKELESMGFDTKTV